MIQVIHFHLIGVSAFEYTFDYMTLVALINTHHLFISFYIRDRLVSMWWLTTGSFGLIYLLSWMREIGLKDCKGVDAQVISLHLMIPRMTKWKCWRCGIRSGYYGKTVKSKRYSVTMDHAAVKGKQEAWHRRTKSGGEERVTALSWWTVRGHLKLQVITSIIWRIYGETVSAFASLKIMKERYKEGISIGIILFLFTFEFRNAVLLRRMQRRGVCVCLGAQSDIS